MVSTAADGIILTKGTHLIGGGEKQTLLLAQGLAKFRPVLILTNPHSPLIDLIPQGVNFKLLDLGPEADRFVPVTRMRLVLSKLKKQVLPQLRAWYSQGYRVIVCQSINEKLVLSGPAQETGFKVVWLDFQSLIPWLPRNPLFGKIKQASKFLDKIITSSNFLKEEHARLGLGPIQVIPPGIILNTKPTKKTLDKNHLIIGVVSRLHREKGIDVFLQAFCLLPNITRAVVVGDGPEKENLLAQAKDLNIAQRIDFVGFQKELKPYYEKFDIFCQPSRRDNTPLAIVEAMSYGVPVVATNTGAIPELVGEAGLIIPSQDDQAMARAIERLIIDEILRDKVTKLGLERSKNYSLSSMAKKFNDQLSA